MDHNKSQYWWEGRNDNFKKRKNTKKNIDNKDDNKEDNKYR